MTSPEPASPAAPVEEPGTAPAADRSLEVDGRSLEPQDRSRVPNGRSRVEADALAHALALTIVDRPAATSLEEAAEMLGISPADIVKSLIVKRHDGSYLFALIPGDRQISWPKLRAIVGVNKLRMPDAATAFAVTGFERGTITPLGSSEAWPIFADQRMLGKRIAMGAGAQGLSAFVEADALIAAYSVTVADISD